MEQLLIIEDDRGLNHGLGKALAESGRRILSCLNIRSAREYLATECISLVLLDISLPDGSGLTLLQEIKAETPQLPVILLTANDTDEDIVTGLNQGADDYITKPFSLAVLRARVATQLRRASAGSCAALYTRGPYIFDFAHHHFKVNNATVELSRTEQKLLQLLVENPGMTMSRDLLTDRIWTDEAEYVEGNALSVTVKRLRDKLHAQKYIKTVYGTGYRWEIP